MDTKILNLGSEVASIIRVLKTLECQLFTYKTIPTDRWSTHMKDRLMLIDKRFCQSVRLVGYRDGRMVKARQKYSNGLSSWINAGFANYRCWKKGGQLSTIEVAIEIIHLFGSTSLYKKIWQCVYFFWCLVPNLAFSYFTKYGKSLFIFAHDDIALIVRCAIEARLESNIFFRARFRWERIITLLCELGPDEFEHGTLI